MPRVVSQLVVVCVFRFRRDRPEYLLLRRSPDEELYPNLWQFVTGMLHEGERAVDGALRECREETGLEPGSFWVVPVCTSFYDAGADAVNLCPVFALQAGDGAEPRLSHEHAEHAWLPFGEAARRLVWPAQREALRIVHDYVVRGEEAGRLLRLGADSRGPHRG